MITEITTVNSTKYYLASTGPIPSLSLAMNVILAALEKGECHFPLFPKELTSVVGAYVINNPEVVSNITLHDIGQIIRNINQVTDGEGRDKHIAALEEDLNSWKYCV
jgi:hypothetical protein